MSNYSTNIEKRHEVCSYNTTKVIKLPLRILVRMIVMIMGMEMCNNGVDNNDNCEYSDTNNDH